MTIPPEIVAPSIAGPFIEKERRRTTIAIYMAFLLIGMTFTIYGPTIPFLMGDYRITMGQAGLFVTFMAMGRMLSVGFSGVLTDRLGRKLLLITGTSLLTLGLFAVGSLTSYWWAISFVILAGVGHGMVDTSGSAAILDMYEKNSSKALNLSHMFFGIGCLIGPLISGTLLTFLPDWRLDFYMKGLAGIFVILFMATRRFAPVERHQTAKTAGGTPLFSGIILLLGLVMFLYSGVGHTLNTWINKYMGDVVNFPVFFAAGSLAIYNMGLTAGRFVCSLMADKVRYNRLILMTSLLSLGSILLALLNRNGGVIVLGLALTGFFFGGLFPTVIAISGRMYPERRGTVTGLLIMMAALGSMTIPALSGFASQWWGLENSMRLLPVLVLVLVIVAIFLQKCSRK